MILAGTTTSAGENSREMFESLLKRTHQQAFHLALRLTGSRTDAEDLVQEAFLRAYRFFHRYDPSLPFTSWLYRIMTNAYIDDIRRRGKLKTSSLDEPHPETGSTWDFPDESASPERLVMTSEMEAEIQEGLNRMTPDFRVAVLLADIEGFSYEEVASIMKTSIGTVRSRIHRGRKQLRSFLVKAKPEKYKGMLE
ncbi:MAG: sigma-70 family RNA polymerase sigma factor [Fimbriimonadales bacterium]|nr:sigma-70 family RNA polymerase sigma factor [Fimbriimonadales bacterium]